MLEREPERVTTDADEPGVPESNSSRSASRNVASSSPVAPLSLARTFPSRATHKSAPSETIPTTSPTSTVEAVTADGSTWVSVPSSKFWVQTWPAATTKRNGAGPVGNTARISPLRGSTRTTVARSGRSPIALRDPVPSSAVSDGTGPSQATRTNVHKQARARYVRDRDTAQGAPSSVGRSIPAVCLRDLPQLGITRLDPTRAPPPTPPDLRLRGWSAVPSVSAHVACENIPIGCNSGRGWSHAQ